MGSLTSVSAAVTVRDVVELLERRYPPELASEWDAVGLACGDPDASVSRILFAVDPVADIVDEALLLQADLIVTHHPLLLRGVHSVAAVGHKGGVIHTLISHGIALFSAHTNADHAVPGVSDALADVPRTDGPASTRPRARTTRARARDGSGRSPRPCPSRRSPRPSPQRSRPPITGCAWPATSRHSCARSRYAGDRVASSSPDAAAAADVYVTSDLRHHRAQDHLVDGGCALVDVAHWASEWPWLPVAADALRNDLAERGSTVEVHVSRIPTDPWTLHLGSTR